MIVFAFPGTGKTTVAQKYQHIVDLEMSDIKYDNSGLEHLTKEERKSVKRPIKDRNYKQRYIQKAIESHNEGKIVLVALSCLFPILLGMIRLKTANYRIYIPHPSLRQEYKKRYINRGNNPRFVWEVMLIWYLTLYPLYWFSKVAPQKVFVLSLGQTLEDRLRDQGFIADFL